jgi:hypothetical protein
MLACEHLQALEADILLAGVQETFRGKAWSANCREWVYFDCVLDVEKLHYRYKLPDFVLVHSNDDRKSGLEAGLVCTICKDAVIGIHQSLSKDRIVFNGT